MHSLQVLNSWGGDNCNTTRMMELAEIEAKKWESDYKFSN